MSAINNSYVSSLNFKRTAIALCLSMAWTTAMAVVIEDGNTVVFPSVGQPSPWTIYDNLVVGGTSAGHLVVNNGGTVISDFGYVGDSANSEGTVTISGIGSSWRAGEELYVGFMGTGRVDVEDGGALVTENQTYLGFDTGSAGHISLTGSAMKTTSLYAGYSGEGTLDITGSVLISRDGFIGLHDGSVGKVRLSGARSAWENSGEIFVGGEGKGTLEIEDGGQVKALRVVLVGNGTQGSSTLTLTGSSNLRSALIVRNLEAAGRVAFNWNGGILQATRDEGDFLRTFTNASVTIGSEGAFFDTQIYNVGFLVPGVLTGTGDFTKYGTGPLSIKGGNTYSGNTNVIYGTLRFDSFSQSATQTLGIDAVSTSTYGKLDVLGTATFAPDANIHVSVVPPDSPILTVGTTLVDVITAGTLTANGFKVTDTSALFNFQAIQRANAVDLKIVANSAAGIRDAVTESGSGYALGAANVLDGQLTSGATGDMGIVVDAFGQLSNNRDIARATAQTLPVISGNQAIQGTLSTIQNLIQNRNGNSSGTTGLSSGDALTNKNGWGKVFGSRAEQDDRSGAAGFKADTWGLALGADAEVAPGARFGVAYGYAKTSVNGNADLTGSAQRANIDSHVVSAYGSKDIGGNRTFSFQGDIGVSDNKSTRHIDFGGLNRTARADYRTYSAHVGAAIAQAIDLSEKTTLSPALRADYMWLKSHGYNENGADALNLNVGSNKTDALVIGADAHLQHRFSTTSRLNASFGVGYDAINKQGNIVAAYAGAPGQSFVTTGIDHSPWLVRGGIGYSLTAANGTAIDFRYDAESRSDYLNHTASVRAKWAF